MFAGDGIAQRVAVWDVGENSCPAMVKRDWNFPL